MIRSGARPGAVLAALILSATVVVLTQSRAGFQLVDVTKASGVRFEHYTAAFGRKYLPETLGAGVIVFDADGDGRQDILLLDGTPWPGQPARPDKTMRLFRNTGTGTFEDVTARSGLAVPMYGMGGAAGDYDNDGRMDLLVTAVGQSRLFRNAGNGRFVDVTVRAGLGGKQGFSTAAAWFDYDRDGRIDVMIGNYVRWTPETDVFCSSDGRTKSYCTPEAYPGATSWLFRNRGDGTFADVTAASGLLDTTSKSLGIALLDYDVDGWPDLFVANDTQPNKLYRNQRDGTFVERGVSAGLAFSEDGRARAGMGADAADLENSGGAPSVAVTNFSGEMLGLFAPVGPGAYADKAPGSELGRASRTTLGFGCFFFDGDLDGRLDLLVANGHIDDNIARGGRIHHAEPPHFFHNQGNGRFLDLATELGPAFAAPKVARGAAYADFDMDGDLDVILTTNGGPAHLYRNDRQSPHRSVRLTLQGTRSNRDAIGARVRARIDGAWHIRVVRTGSSYLSQSELPVTFGLGARTQADEVVIEWPAGRQEKLGPIVAGRAYTITEGAGITADTPLETAGGQRAGLRSATRATGDR